MVYNALMGATMMSSINAQSIEIAHVAHRVIQQMIQRRKDAFDQLRRGPGLGRRYAPPRPVFYARNSSSDLSLFHSKTLQEFYGKKDAFDQHVQASMTRVRQALPISTLGWRRGYDASRS
jgi:hypothetical protein